MRTLLSFLLAMLMALPLASCGPKVQRWNGTPYIYVDTKDGRFWGVETFDQRRLDPIYDSIDNTAFSREAYEASKDGVTILYDYFGRPLCDSIPLTSQQIEYPNGGSGIPGKHYLVHTIKGVFALYYDEDKASWYQYGPFGDYAAGTTAYMFEDKKTGKWGIGRYGHWKDLGDEKAPGLQRVTLDSQWHFIYRRDSVFINPQYEQIINIVYVPTEASLDGGRKGYTHKSEIKWYAYDGKKWHGFDFDGKSIPVKISELNLALKLTPHRGRAHVNRMNNVVTQRIGTREASMVIINNHPYSVPI